MHIFNRFISYSSMFRISIIQISLVSTEFSGFELRSIFEVMMTSQASLSCWVSLAKIRLKNLTDLSMIESELFIASKIANIVFRYFSLFCRTISSSPTNLLNLLDHAKIHSLSYFIDTKISLNQTSIFRSFINV